MGYTVGNNITINNIDVGYKKINNLSFNVVEFEYIRKENEQTALEWTVKRELAKEHCATEHFKAISGDDGKMVIAYGW